MLLDTPDLAFLCLRAGVPSIAALGLQVTSSHSSPVILKELFCFEFLMKIFLREGDLGRRGLILGRKALNREGSVSWADSESLKQHQPFMPLTGWL